MSTNAESNANEEEKKREDDEKQEQDANGAAHTALTTSNAPQNDSAQPIHDDEAGDDVILVIPNMTDDSHVAADDDIPPIDEEKTSEAFQSPPHPHPHPASATEPLQDIPGIPEDEKQSPSHSNANATNDTETAHPKQSEDQKVNGADGDDDEPLPDTTNTAFDRDDDDDGGTAENEAQLHIGADAETETENKVEAAAAQPETESEIESESKEHKQTEIAHSNSNSNADVVHDATSNGHNANPPNHAHIAPAPPSAPEPISTQPTKSTRIVIPRPANRFTTPPPNPSQRKTSKLADNAHSTSAPVSPLRPHKPRKWPRELGLSRLYYTPDTPTLTVNVNEHAAPPVPANMKQTSLLWFVHEKLDEHILDRCGYHSTAITAQLMAFPLHFGSSQLRIIDRFYHRYAHHFHAAYLNQLKKQTLHATKQPLRDEAFYSAIGGKDVSRPSMVYGTDDAKQSWVDLDGSQLVPSAIAGIQRHGAVTVLFVRIGERPTDKLSLKKKLTLPSVRDAMASSVRWHPASAHTILVTQRATVRLFRVDRDFEGAQNVLTLDLSAQMSLDVSVADRNMVTSLHYSADSDWLMALHGPKRRSFGLVPEAAHEGDIAAMKDELDASNFVIVYRLTKYAPTDPRRRKAKHLDDLTDYDAPPQIIARLSHEKLSQTSRAFDVEHVKDGDVEDSVELFQHCIVLQPNVSEAKCKMIYFATVSKVIGVRRSMVTLWALDYEYDAKLVCVQRATLSTPSVNTLVTSLEYNRYSRPYLVMTSTTFDPFQTHGDYVDARRRYMAKRVLLQPRYDEASSGSLAEPDRNSVVGGELENELLYVDFSLKSKASQFHSHCVSVAWSKVSATKEKKSTPFISCVLSKCDTSPCPQLIPCRSLYRFVESSLIGARPELKHLRLYTRRQTIGLLRVGVFAFKYFELYTPESIKLRRPSKLPSPRAKLSSQLSANTAILKAKRQSNGNGKHKPLPTHKEEEVVIAHEPIANGNSTAVTAASAASSATVLDTESLFDSSPSTSVKSPDLTGSGKKRKVKKSEQQFYHRLDRMLSQHHSQFLLKLDTKLEHKLKTYQDREGSLGQGEVAAIREAVETLQAKYDELQSGLEWLSPAALQQQLSEVVTEQIMPKLGVYMMGMFKNFVNHWIVPQINEALKHEANDTKNSSSKLSAADAERMTAAVTKPLQDVMQRMSSSLSSAINKNGQQTLGQMNIFQRALDAKVKGKGVSGVSPQQLKQQSEALETMLAAQKSMQQQMSALLDEVKNVHTNQAALSAAIQSVQSAQKHTQREIERGRYTASASVPSAREWSSFRAPPRVTRSQTLPQRPESFGMSYEPYSINSPQRPQYSYAPTVAHPAHSEMDAMRVKMQQLQHELERLSSTQMPQHRESAYAPHSYHPPLSAVSHSQPPQNSQLRDVLHSHYASPQVHAPAPTSAWREREAPPKSKLWTRPENAREEKQSTSEPVDDAQPFVAMSAMLKYKNYDFVLELMAQTDLAALFEDGFARDRAANECVVTFDLLNRLLWMLAETVPAAPGTRASNVELTEWMAVLLENVSRKDADFDANVLERTMHKMEANLASIPAKERGVKGLQRNLKYLDLLCAKWRALQR